MYLQLKFNLPDWSAISWPWSFLPDINLIL